MRALYFFACFFYLLVFFQCLNASMRFILRTCGLCMSRSHLQYLKSFSTCNLIVSNALVFSFHAYDKKLFQVSHSLISRASSLVTRCHLLANVRTAAPTLAEAGARRQLRLSTAQALSFLPLFLRPRHDKKKNFHPPLRKREESTIL